MKLIAGAASALLLTAGLATLPTSAEATNSTTASGASQRTCYKSQYGESVKVRIRYDDSQSKTRVRVSHPDGRGVFRNSHVKKVFVGLTYDGSPPVTEPPVRFPASRSFYPSSGGKFTAAAAFRMTNGKTIHLSCTLGES